MELSPQPYPASITKNKPVNDAIFALFMTLIPFNEGFNALV
jgi:hypothetical protein